MTIPELRKAIKRQTEVINERLIEYYEADGTDKLVNKEIEYLKTVTGTSNRKVYLSMNTHRKNKAELELQLAELRYFNEWDIFTPQGMAERTQREKKAWRSYKRNSGSRLQFETYRRMVNIMGTIGYDMLKQFGGSYSDAVEEAVKKGRKPGAIKEAMEKIIAKNKNKQLSDRDYFDQLVAELDIRL